MKRLHRSGVCALALMAGMAAMDFEPAVLRDLAFGDGSRHVSIGAVKTSLWSAAFAQSAESFTLENVKFAWGSSTYEAKRLTFDGASVARSDIENLFSSGTEPFADRLARIRVRQVTAPELKVTQTLGAQTQTSLYRNISVNDVVDGKIASMTAETAAIEATGQKGPTLISYGRSAVSDLDLAAFARLYETKDATAPLTKIYGAFSIETIDAASREGDGGVQIARLSGRDLMARPTADSWSGTLGLIRDLSEKETTTPEDQTRLLQGAADLLGAFDAGFVEAAGVAFKGGGADNKGTGTIARIAYTGANGAQPAETRLEGIELADAESRVKVGAVSLTGFSVAPTLEGLKAFGSKPLTDLDHADMRRLIPTLGTLRITGLDVDATSNGGDGQKPERTQMSVESVEVTADRPLNGIPTNIRIEHRNAALALPASSSDEFIRQLIALGYRTFNSSMTLAATWNEASNEIDLQEVSLQGQDMGSLRLTGLIGNAGPDLFSPDEATASAALIGAKAKAASLTVENRGLVERYFAQSAKEAGTTPEALQAMYSGATPLVLSSMIGNSEQARILGQAIARFIQKPGRLTVDAQPKNPSGFGLMDVMLTSDPKALLDKLTIAARAE